MHNLWCAADVGLPVQPDNIVAQVESSLIYALGSALKERITIKNGQVEQSNFHDYQVLRMSEIPQMHVEIIRSGETRHCPSVSSACRAWCRRCRTRCSR